MQVCILSDSHMIPKSQLESFFQQLNVDYIIHCGDIYMTYQENDLPQIIHVRGNNDRYSPLEQIIEIDQLRFFITHGHHYQVDQSIHLLQDYAAIHQIDVVCFGHTHIPYFYQDEHTTYINPGSLAFPRGLYRYPTYCIFDTHSKKVTYYNYKTGEVCDPFKKTEKKSFFHSLFKK